MIVYAESSAVLAWIRGEREGSRSRSVLRDASRVIASDLTLMECHRVLIRALALDEATEEETTERQRRLDAASAKWQILGIGPEVVERAKQRMPEEPVRTLDAIHLASALVARSSIPDLIVLSLDERVRKSAEQLGFILQPPTQG